LPPIPSSLEESPSLTLTKDALKQHESLLASEPTPQLIDDLVDEQTPDSS